MFLSTFLFTSSTCLPCCGRLCAGCLYSWSREQRLGHLSLARESLWRVSLAPGPRELETAGNRSSVTFAETKTLWKRLQGCSVWTSYRTPAVVISQRVWAGTLCLRLWHQALQFKVSGPVVLFHFSPTSLSTLHDYCRLSDHLCIQLCCVSIFKAS